MRTLLFGVLIMQSCLILAQSTDSSRVTVSGYADLYYSFDADNPDDHLRPDFLVSHNRHNEVTLNLGFVKAAYDADNLRANMALMAGTYPNANLAQEEGLLKHVFEANAGVKLCKSKQVWLDAGIFPSHIGFESAISKDAWNVTRSMVADNSPYYESGLKFSYTSDNNKLYLSLLVLNGWQRIQRIDGNNTPAGGYQITFRPNDKILFNSSFFAGNEFVDNVGRVRFYHNFYTILQLHKYVGLTLGFDYGAQQIARDSDEYHEWYAPVGIVRITPADWLNIAGRVEYFHDEDGVIIDSNTPNGFKTWGYSGNIDISINENALWRFEGRVFESKDQVFILDDQPDRQNYCVTSSVVVTF